MRRIFVEPEKISNSKAELTKEDFHYLKNVLRLPKGAEMAVFDGFCEYFATLDEKYLNIVKVARMAENTLPTRLAIGAIKQPRFEWLIEKATEIGCTEIFILSTEFSQTTIRNYDRLKKIAIEAARQSNRISLPKIHFQKKLPEFLSKIDDSWAFAHPWEGSNPSSPISELQPKYRGIIVGPEGGFSYDEEKLLEKHCKKVRLSVNVLRAETAALVSLSYIANSLLNQQICIQSSYER